MSNEQADPLEVTPRSMALGVAWMAICTVSLLAAIVLPAGFATSIALPCLAIISLPVAIGSTAQRGKYGAIVGLILCLPYLALGIIFSIR